MVEIPYGGNPAGSDDDALKFLLGDVSTSASGELLSTGEIGYLIATYGSVAAAGPWGARAIAAQYALQADKEVGDLKIAASQKFDQYMTLAASLAVSLVGSAALAAMPYAGGISIADKDANRSDTDRVVPSFRVGMHDNPQGGSVVRST